MEARPAAYRVFLRLRFIDGLSNEEIFQNEALCERLGLKTMPTLKSSMLRARRMFMSELKDISSRSKLKRKARKPALAKTPPIPV